MAKRRFELVSIRNGCLDLRGRVEIMALRYSTLEDRLEKLGAFPNDPPPIVEAGLERTRPNRERLEAAGAMLAEAARLIWDATDLIDDASRKP